MAREQTIGYSNRPDRASWPEVSDEIVKNTDAGEPLTITLDDQFHLVLTAMNEFGRGGPKNNTWVLTPDFVFYRLVADNGCLPLPAIQGLIDQAVAKSTADNVLHAVMEYLQAQGADVSALAELFNNGVNVNVDHPIYQAIVAELPAILEEVLPPTDGSVEITPDLVPNMHALFMEKLQALLIKVLPADIAVAVDLAKIAEFIPEVNFVTDLDIGPLAKRINLTTLMRNIVILSWAVNLAIWTEYVTGAEDLVNEAAAMGVNISNANVFKKIASLRSMKQAWELAQNELAAKANGNNGNGHHEEVSAQSTEQTTDNLEG